MRPSASRFIALSYRSPEASPSAIASSTACARRAEIAESDAGEGQAPEGGEQDAFVAKVARDRDRVLEVFPGGGRSRPDHGIAQAGFRHRELTSIAGDPRHRDSGVEQLTGHAVVAMP